MKCWYVPEASYPVTQLSKIGVLGLTSFLVIACKSNCSSSMNDSPVDILAVQHVKQGIESGASCTGQPSLYYYSFKPNTERENYSK